MKDLKITEEWLNEQDKLYRLEQAARLIRYDIKGSTGRQAVKLELALEQIRQAIKLEMPNHRTVKRPRTYKVHI